MRRDDRVGTVEAWRTFWHDPPGRRFQSRYTRQRSGLLGRWVRATLGALLVVVGIVFMPLPGPGILGVIAGAALLAGESATVARWLDRAELYARRVLHR